MLFSFPCRYGLPRLSLPGCPLCTICGKSISSWSFWCCAWWGLLQEDVHPLQCEGFRSCLHPGAQDCCPDVLLTCTLLYFAATLNTHDLHTTDHQLLYFGPGNLPLLHFHRDHCCNPGNFHYCSQNYTHQLHLHYFFTLMIAWYWFFYFVVILQDKLCDVLLMYYLTSWKIFKLGSIIIRHTWASMLLSRAKWNLL